MNRATVKLVVPSQSNAPVPVRVLPGSVVSPVSPISPEAPSVASTGNFASGRANRRLGTTKPAHVSDGRFSPTKRAAAAIGVVAIVALAGCTSDKSSETTSAAMASEQVAPADQSANADMNAAAAAETAAAAAPSAAVAGKVAEFNTAGDQVDAFDGSGINLPTGGSAIPVTPQTGAQIKRAELTVQLTSAQFRTGVAQATQLPGSVGGFVQSSQIGGGNPIDAKHNEPRFAVVVMRVPAARFDDVRGRLGGLGKLVNENISGEEVSAQLVDLQARATSLLLQEEAYKKLFNAATKIQDIITVQERLTEVRTQIEQISAQKTNLGNQVAMSTITVNLQEKVKADRLAAKTKAKKAKGFGDQVSKSWKGGTKALGNVLTAFVVVLVALAPFVPFLLIAGLLGSYFVRRNRRSDAARLAASATVLPATVLPLTVLPATVVPAPDPEPTKVP